MKIHYAKKGKEETLCGELVGTVPSNDIKKTITCKVCLKRLNYWTTQIKRS